MITAGLFLALSVLPGKQVAAESSKHVMGEAGAGFTASEEERQFSQPEKEFSSYPDTLKADGKIWNKVGNTCYNGVGEVIPGAITRGIDVSQWQGTINWTQVKKSNVDFAFIRCGYSYPVGNNMGFVADTQYKNNMNNAIKAGVPVGVYIYSEAMTTAQAVQDAKRVIAAVKGYKISYPLVIDFEDKEQEALSKTQITNMINAFAKEIKSAGYYPMVYTNLNWTLYHYYPQQVTCDIWMARYYDSATNCGASFTPGIWQATCGATYMGLKDTTGMISGISTNVDINFGYVDYTKKIVPRTAPAGIYGYTGWLNVGSNTYYYQNGVKLTGFRKIGTKYYYFTSAGVMRKNVLMVSSKKEYFYLGSDGARVEYGWVQYNGRYYFMRNGVAIKGLQTVGKNVYYFSKTYGYRAENMLIGTNGQVYYFGKNGVQQRGWVKLEYNGKPYYHFFSLLNGAAYRGWHSVGGKLYYFRGGTNLLTGSRLENCTVAYKGKWYRFAANGVATLVK